MSIQQFELVIKRNDELPRTRAYQDRKTQYLVSAWVTENKVKTLFKFTPTTLDQTLRTFGIIGQDVMTGDLPHRRFSQSYYTVDDCLIGGHWTVTVIQPSTE
jgi:hypothetical protein